MKDVETDKGNSRLVPRACGLFMAHHRHVRKRKRQTKQLREETMKRIIVVCGVMGVVFVLVGVGFYIGEQAGTAHKIVEKQLAFKAGFEAGKSCKIGALGVPLGTRCKVRGWIDKPLHPMKKSDDAENVFYINVHSINGKGCRATLKVLLNKDEAAGVREKYEFIGYETIKADGVPAWLNEGRVSAPDYFVEHYFVITDAPCGGKQKE